MGIKREKLMQQFSTTSSVAELRAAIGSLMPDDKFKFVLLVVAEIDDRGACLISSDLDGEKAHALIQVAALHCALDELQAAVATKQ